MPQFDQFSFLNQVFFFLILFLDFYFFISLIFLPILSKNLKIRNKKIFLNFKNSLNFKFLNKQNKNQIDILFNNILINLQLYLNKINSLNIFKNNKTKQKSMNNNFLYKKLLFFISIKNINIKIIFSKRSKAHLLNN